MWDPLTLNIRIITCKQKIRIKSMLLLHETIHSNYTYTVHIRLIYLTILHFDLWYVSLICKVLINPYFGKTSLKNRSRHSFLHTHVIQNLAQRHSSLKNRLVSRNVLEMTGSKSILIIELLCGVGSDYAFDLL
jgi:hypothetical protein